MKSEKLVDGSGPGYKKTMKTPAKHKERSSKDMGPEYVSKMKDPKKIKSAGIKGKGKLDGKLEMSKRKKDPKM